VFIAVGVTDPGVVATGITRMINKPGSASTRIILDVILVGVSPRVAPMVSQDWAAPLLTPSRFFQP